MIDNPFQTTGAGAFGDAYTYRARFQPFPAPWFDYASTQLPATLWDALRLCEFLVTTQPVYRSAIERVISYFITEIDIIGTDREGKRSYKDLLENILGIHSHLKSFGLDYFTYGNAFVSVIAPFEKFARCEHKNCSFETTVLRLLDNSESTKAKWADGNLRAICPQCKRPTNWQTVTRRNIVAEKLIIKRWSPFEIEIEFDPFSGATRHIWRIPAYFRTEVARGSPLVIANAPDEVLQAAAKNQNIRFYPSELFHAKVPTLAGHILRGWGISPLLAHFRQAWLVALFHRHNEAVALDYIIPLRILTPAARGGAIGDALAADDAGVIAQQLHFAVQARRYDPTSWAIFPFPVQYQFVGAEASHLAPVQLLEYIRAELLESVGIPMELYKGSLSVQAAPAALRLFETNWSYVIHIFNRFLQWVVDKIAALLDWDRVQVKLLKPSISDDINKQLAKIQLMQAGLVSKSTALRGLGIEDFIEETQQSLTEEKQLTALMEKAKEDIEKSQAMRQLLSIPVGTGDAEAVIGGQPPAIAGGPMPPQAGGMAGPPPAQGQPPVPPGPVSPAEQTLAQLTMRQSTMTVQDLEQIATTLAQQLFSLPLGQRISELRKLRVKNPTVHALVKAKIEEMDREMGRMARRAMMPR